MSQKNNPSPPKITPTKEDIGVPSDGTSLVSSSCPLKAQRLRHVAAVETGTLDIDKHPRRTWIISLLTHSHFLRNPSGLSIGLTSLTQFTGPGLVEWMASDGRKGVLSKKVTALTAENLAKLPSEPIAANHTPAPIIPDAATPAAEPAAEAPAKAPAEPAAVAEAEQTPATEFPLGFDALAEAAPADNADNGNDSGFTAEQDAELIRMKTENATWAEITEALGKDKSTLQQRFKEIKPADFKANPQGGGRNKAGRRSRGKKEKDEGETWGSGGDQKKDGGGDAAAGYSGRNNTLGDNNAVEDNNAGGNSTWGGDAAGDTAGDVGGGWGDTAAGGGNTRGANNDACGANDWASNHNPGNGANGSARASKNGSKANGSARESQNGAGGNGNESGRANGNGSNGNGSGGSNQGLESLVQLSPDETFSLEDLKCIARILKEDGAMLWERVSYRFQDKNPGRRIHPDVFEKKVTGTVAKKGRSF
ncbi:hypothetical protein K469DRAFT_752183 [Zopfia rhizophila CBS 207.26]|uniref:Myb-like domain-containing protein n=1 Tax=Zopfia rhizophila CBS 207.26 TaxID=1314779 RepID=A0A6A6DVM1_9PEZI|nr:hypothetical protein K469DRAFT_752183 [Zopfia rhizophila CBS 207.26]